ncbi:MAG: hypothetical protein M3R44_02165 [Candidatus Eremiobacteraeota bacterium]|nr:hypothetical protein [Candidatus Eremiobacteraeota bacterium]
MRYLPGLGASLLLGLAVSACSTNGSAVNPTVTQTNVQSNSKLRLAVGTVNIAADGAVGLNVVATLRQPDGNSATLANLPTIVGPPGFTVPNTSAIISPVTAPSPMVGGGDGGSGADAGTNHISGAPQQPPNPTLTPLLTTFGQYGGLFSYGFGPYNSDQTGAAYYPGVQAGGPAAIFFEPFYTASGLPYVGGPPAYPFFNDGTHLSNFIGYVQGFAAFETPPVVGSYQLTVAVPAANAPSTMFNANAALSNTAPLPALAAPTFTSDSVGGGSGTVIVPTDPRIVETMVYAVDFPAAGGADNFYSVGPLTGTGTLAFTLPDLLGPCSGTKGVGCQNDSTKQTPSIPTGDAYAIYAASYDYPAYESSPPVSTSQTPPITGTSTQADVSLSPATGGTYPMAAARRPAFRFYVPTAAHMR